MAAQPAATPARPATFESGEPLGEVDRFEAVNGTIAAGDGAVAMRFGGAAGGNGYARLVEEVGWEPGAEVWFGASFRLPGTFAADQQGQVDLLRWDNYPDDAADTEKGGLVVSSSHAGRVVRIRQGAFEEPVTGPIALPLGRWFTVVVHQRLSTVHPLTEVVIDGTRVAASVQPNSFGHRVLRLRAGIVAIDAVAQRRQLGLSVDDVFAGTEPPAALERPVSP